MTVTFQAQIIDASIPQLITNTVAVTSDQTIDPATASVITEVRTQALAYFIDDSGFVVNESTTLEIAMISLKSERWPVNTI